MDITDGGKTVSQFDRENQGTSHTSHNTGHSSGGSVNYDHRTSSTGVRHSNQGHQFEFVDKEATNNRRSSANDHYSTSTSTSRSIVLPVNFKNIFKNLLPKI